MKTSAILLCVLSLCIFGILSKTAIAAPTLEDYGRLPSISQIAISPNGEYLAFRRTEKEQDLIFVHSATETKPITAIDVSSIDPNDLFFHDNDTIILQVSVYKKLRSYRHAFDLSTAFSYNFRNNTIEPLIRLGENIKGQKSIAVGQTGMGRILGKSADGKHLFMPAYVSDKQGDQTPNYSLLQVNTNGKGRPRIHSKGTYNTEDYFLDNKGNVLAIEHYNERTNIHKMVARLNKKWVTIYEEKKALRTHNFIGITADFKNLVLTLIEAGSERNAYFTMRLTDGKVKKLPYGRDDADIESPIIDDNRVILGLTYSGLFPSYRFFNEKQQQQMDKILAVFPEHSVYLIDWSNNWEKVLVKVEGSQNSGDYYTFSKQGDYSFIASAYPKVKHEDVNPLAKIRIKARDGRIIPTLLTIPKNRLESMKNLPAVVLPHGGPASYDTMNFNYMAQALASQGMIVIQPQFRGSTGFGFEHRRAGNGEWGKKMQDDITDALALVIKKGIVDEKRVCIAGASYGGYAALAGAAFTPNLYQCAVSIAGISHIPKMLQEDKSRYGKNSWILTYFEKIIGDGNLDKNELREISPYFHANKVKIPVLLIHGVDDTIVDYEQSKIMHSALKKAKIDSKLVKLKNEDHHLRDSETRLQCLKEMVSFILRHIGEEKTKQ